uniref:PCI domain-containing protein n=1 Tax=Musa acuminata subsp. malaccensis TaxID=214687 RepID=A0A804JT08_MUSAM
MADPSLTGALQYLEAQRHAQPELADWYSAFADLYQRKLWHQLTLKLEQFVRLADLAFDLSLSALLGDNVFNFGELLAHPIINSLTGTNVEWLYHILHAFNSGNLLRYQELCRVHNIALCAQPALVENEKKLLEKINILCLMEIISSRPSEDRTIPLSVIAERTKLSIEDVEYLLMKSLSVHLIEGIIDQVEGTVHVSWVQPRVLGIPQISSLRDRLDTWVGKVRQALLSVEAETPDLVACA